MKKILIRGLRGIKCQKIGFFWHYIRNATMIFFNFQMTISPTLCNMWPTCRIRKKIIQDKQGIKCQKLIFLTFFEKRHFFCMMIEDNTVQHLVSRYQVARKIIQGLAGIKCKKNSVLWHFLWNATMILFYFLQDDRGQHCATFRLGVWFQKK